MLLASRAVRRRQYLDETVTPATRVPISDQPVKSLKRRLIPDEPAAEPPSKRHEKLAPTDGK